MSKKKCLFILSRLPYPPVGGDKLKSYNLVKILNQRYDLSIVVITDEKITPEIDDFLINNTVSYKIFAFPKYRFYMNGLKGLFGKEPIQVAYYYFRECFRYIQSIRGQNDFIIANLIRTSKYVIDAERPKFLDMVDSIGLNYTNSVQHVKSIFWKKIYQIELPRILKFEKTCVEKFDNSFLVNKHESEYWSEFGKVSWIPNGVNTKLFNYRKKNLHYNNAIVFLGKMDYQPNIDAVLWYVKNVHPLISPDIIFYIIGTKPTKEIQKLASIRNIVVTGFMEDPYEVIYSAKLMIAPMQTGAGIQNKILEAMALGKVVITSSLGAKPIIGAVHMEHIIVADESIAFAEYITNFCNNIKGKYAQIGENARQLIQKNYTWERYEKTLVSLIDDKLSTHKELN